MSREAIAAGEMGDKGLEWRVEGEWLFVECRDVEASRGRIELGACHNLRVRAQKFPEFTHPRLRMV
jgi:hypothetical protein